jgi:hypothetical protein
MVSGIIEGFLPGFMVLRSDLHERCLGQQPQHQPIQLSYSVWQRTNEVNEKHGPPFGGEIPGCVLVRVVKK